MATIQEIKKRKKQNVTSTVQEITTKEKTKVGGVGQKAKTTEEVTPINKYKEWKLLYKTFPLKGSDKNTSPLNKSQFRSATQEKNPGNPLGLCANCKKRKACKLPKPEGGVWRCDEYE